MKTISTTDLSWLTNNPERLERLGDRVRDGLSPQDGCWLWTGRQNGAGYGVISVYKPGQRTKTQSKCKIRVHRAAALLAGMDIDGAVVRHSCDVKLCCKPEHLSVGTHADNIKDRDTRNRVQHGEKHYRAKLNADSVQMLWLGHDAGMSNNALSRALGVLPSTIASVLKGQTWRRESEGMGRRFF